MDGCLEEGRQGNEGVGQKEELINGGKGGEIVMGCTADGWLLGGEEVEAPMQK